jgi:hypothetical protein
MNSRKKMREIANAMHDHRIVTVNLTRGRSVKGRISGMSDIFFRVGLNPRNRFRIDRVESVQLH